MTLSGNPSVSVVIPTHDEGEWLQGTVDAVFANTRHHPFEVIVVDDGSTDGSCQFLETGRYRQLPVKRVVGNGLGVAGARNRGAQAATGEILVFLDAHVLPDPGWLCELVELLSEPSVGLAGLCIRSVDDASSRGCTMAITGPDLNVDWAEWPSDNAPFDAPGLVGCCQATRREVFSEIGGFDARGSRYGFEDIELSIRTWLMGYRCVVSPRVEVAHLFKSSSQRAFEVTWEEYDVNLLRAALTLLSGRWATEVINCLKAREHFAASLCRVVDDPAFWRRREDLRSRFVRDDEWYFTRFAHLMDDSTSLDSSAAEGSREDHMMKMTRLHRHCPECGAENIGPHTTCLLCQTPLPAPAETEGERTCPECGRHTAPGSRFCVYCGAALTSESTTASLSCPECGGEIAAGKKFCTNCGAPLG